MPGWSSRRSWATEPARTGYGRNAIARSGRSVVKALTPAAKARAMAASSWATEVAYSHRPRSRGIATMSISIVGDWIRDRLDPTLQSR